MTAPSKRMDRDSVDWLARLIAVEAPERGQAGCAKIPWDVIDQLRKALEREGFDWRRAVRHRKALEELRSVTSAIAELEGRTNPLGDGDRKWLEICRQRLPIRQAAVAKFERGAQ